MNYNDAVKFLDSLQSTNIKLGLERISAACEALGHPEKKFPSVIVAGTNGKGSTCAFLESILRHAGLKVGLYTSPHLVDVRERIQINREMISKEEFAERTFHVSRFTSDATYFEFLTAMAFEYFAEKRVDIAVLEVGLGGRYDSTNVVEPSVSIITRIGMDHMGYLGDTIEKIAYEKAGVIKKGVPVVTVDQEPRVMGVLRRVADENGSMLHVVSPQEVKYKLGLAGRHQYENAALALRAAELVSENVPRSTFQVSGVAEAFASARWAGRLEVISKDPLVILDGAHNPNGAETLARYLRELKKEKRIILMLGIMADKDIGGIVGPLAEVADEIVMTRPSGTRAADPNKLANLPTCKLANYRIIEPLSAAIDETMKTMDANSALIIAGSLYTVGEAREHLNNKR